MITTVKAIFFVQAKPLKVAYGIGRTLSNWLITKHKFLLVLFAIYEFVCLTFLRRRNRMIVSLQLNSTVITRKTKNLLTHEYTLICPIIKVLPCRPCFD